MTPDFRIYLLQLLFSILYKVIKARKSQKLEWKFSKKLFFNGDISSITFRFLPAFFVSLSGFQNLSRPLSVFAKANETFCLLAKNKFPGTLIIGRREISPPYPRLLPLTHRAPCLFLPFMPVTHFAFYRAICWPKNWLGRKQWPSSMFHLTRLWHFDIVNQ